MVVIIDPQIAGISGDMLLSSLVNIGANKSKIIDELVVNTRNVAAKVIELKGATIHAPGNAVSSIVEAILRNTKQVIPVATYLDGEYGFSDVSIGVPAVVGKNGIDKIIELDLDSNEKEWLKKGVDSVKNAISTLEI